MNFSWSSYEPPYPAGNSPICFHGINSNARAIKLSA